MAHVIVAFVRSPVMPSATSHRHSCSSVVSFLAYVRSSHFQCVTVALPTTSTGWAASIRAAPSRWVYTITPTVYPRNSKRFINLKMGRVLWRWTIKTLGKTMLWTVRLEAWERLPGLVNALGAHCTLSSRLLLMFLDSLLLWEQQSDSSSPLDLWLCRAQ